MGQFDVMETLFVLEVNKVKSLLFFFLLCFASLLQANPAIKVIGLFKDKALVEIEGKHKMMRKGESYREYILEYADSKRAIISLNGVSSQYLLGTSGGGIQFKKAKSSAYHIKANQHGMYLTQGSINNQLMNFIVDTGATFISMNKAHADSLGIDVIGEGQPINIRTASAIVKGYSVTLESVKVGSININNVEATVLLGEQPDTVLLGMSFLKHLKVKHSGSVMTFEKL